MEELKPGDLVQLKSGGPTMTVRRFEKLRSNWVCDWFVDTAHFHAEFREEQLKKV